MKFKELISTINLVHTKTYRAVASAINQGLSIRNWLVGYYIVEFEQQGAERATYGDKLLVSIAKEIKQKGFSASDLSRYRQFYLTYPNILATVSQSSLKEIDSQQILATVSQKSETSNIQLISKLSFSHFRELIKIEDNLKRTFYETECINGTWSVRELKRQINALYFERSALSKNKKKLSAHTNKSIGSSQVNPIKDYYIFEFLGLPKKEIITESDLETSLLDN